jgi:antitoxin (DNA-binding transcriptional repressor) of toxin-antitoxin stability system
MLARSMRNAAYPSLIKSSTDGGPTDDLPLEKCAESANSRKAIIALSLFAFLRPALRSQSFFASAHGGAFGHYKKIIDMTRFLGYILVMIKLNLHEVKTQFSKYIEMVEAGDTVVVCKRNVPVAEIRPIGKTKARKPVLGSARGLVRIPANFNEPLTEAELHSWYDIADTDPLKKLTLKSGKRRK